MFFSGQGPKIFLYTGSRPDLARMQVPRLRGHMLFPLRPLRTLPLRISKTPCFAGRWTPSVSSVPPPHHVVTDTGKDLQAALRGIKHDGVLLQVLWPTPGD